MSNIPEIKQKYGPPYPIPLVVKLIMSHIHGSQMANIMCPYTSLINGPEIVLPLSLANCFICVAACTQSYTNLVSYHGLTALGQGAYHLLHQFHLVTQRAL